MKEVLTGSGGDGMSDNSVDLILKAIDDMQTKINSEMEDKLQNFVTKPAFNDLEQEVKAITRRVGHNEGLVKNSIAETEKNGEMIESSRKKMARLQTEIDQLKRNTSSAMSLHESPSRTAEDTTAHASAATAAEGGENVSSEGLDKLQKLLQRVEGNLIRRIAQVESTANKVHDLQDELDTVKIDLARALAPRGPQITDDDVEKWNRNLETTDALEELVKKLKSELAILDGPRIKADILQIFKVQNNFVSKTDMNPLNERISKTEQQVQDFGFEINSLRDQMDAINDKIKANHSEAKQDVNQLRAHLDSNEQTLVSHKKMLTMLDERIKSMAKAAAMSGNTAMAGNLLQDMEDNIEKLRKEF